MESHVSEGGVDMVTVGLLVRLATKPGRELELEQFLRSALPLVENEPGTTAWFALKFGPFSFGIFDAFRMTPTAKPTWPGALRQPSWQVQRICWLHLPT